MRLRRTLRISLCACALLAAQGVWSLGPQALAQAEQASSDEPSWELMHRRYASRDGSTGGFRIVEPGSGEPGAVRIALGLDSAPADDFLRSGTEIAQSRRQFLLSVTALSALELFASLSDQDTTARSVTPWTVSTQASTLGAKLYTGVLAPVHLGADLRLVGRSDSGGDLFLLKATSVGLRGAASFDFRELPVMRDEVPLIARLNLDYLFDNSAVVIEQIEAARYSVLRVPRGPEDETRHLVSREDRFALGVSRVDRFTIGLGLEAPVEVAERTFVHPVLEWQLGLPVNRQGYDCAQLPGATGDQSTDDGCLGDVGLSAYPMTLTAGLRVAPPIRGVSLAVSVDVSLSGHDRFVRELAAMAPVMIGLVFGYDYDARPDEPCPEPVLVPEVEAIEATPAPSPVGKPMEPMEPVEPIEPAAPGAQPATEEAAASPAPPAPAPEPIPESPQ